jgi:hypothetical protein
MAGQLQYDCDHHNRHDESLQMDVQDMCKHIGNKNHKTKISETVPYQTLNVQLQINQQYTPTRPQV